MNKELAVMLDLDGTMLSGPASWGSLWKLFVEKRLRKESSGESVGNGKFNSLALPYIFAATTVFNRVRHRRRELDPQAEIMLLGLGALAKDLGMEIVPRVLTGRGESELGEMTRAQMDFLSLSRFIPPESVFIRPDEVKSSRGWKRQKLAETVAAGECFGAVMVENDLRTAVTIGTWAEEQGHNIGVVLKESRETSQGVLRVLGLSREDIPNSVKVVSGLAEVPQVVRELVDSWRGRVEEQGK